jgi:hypothetical protein
MGDEVCDVVLDILKTGVMPATLNLTYIALIPKVETSSGVIEFRPIILCMCFTN